MIGIDKKEKTIRTAFTVSMVIAISKIAGAGREMVFAAYFGQSLQSDAYVTAYTILNITAIAFGAAIGSTFIPIYTKTRLNHGENSAGIYASNILNLYVICGIIVSAAGYLLAPQICGLVYQGSQEGLNLTIYLIRIMYPTILFWAIAGVLSNILDAHKNFIPEQLKGLALTFCVIIACIFFKSIKSVAVSTSIAGILQVVILLPFIRGKYKYKPLLNLRNKELRRTFLLALPALIGIAFDDINNLTDKIFSSSMGVGMVTALSKSFFLVQMAVGILIVPLTTIMFSELSHFAALGQVDKLKESVRKSLETVALITLPVIMISLVCSRDIIGVVYQHGNFTAADTALTAPVFSLYIIGLFGFGTRAFLTQFFYSTQKTRVPLFCGIFSVSLNIVLDLLLKGVLGVKGLTLATSIASFTGAMLMLVILHIQVGKINFRQSIRQIVKTFIAAGFCLAAALAVHRFIPLHQTDFTSNFLRLLACGSVGMIVYFLMTLLLKIETVGLVMDIIRQRFLKKSI